jgi:SET domain-containing protein
MESMRRNYVADRRLATGLPSRVRDTDRQNRSSLTQLLPPVFSIRRFKRKGRGLVATEQIPAGVRIVTCPVIVYDDEDAGRISKTRLGDYNFRFGERQNRACIVLGAISLCNHADEPNAEIVCNETELTVTLVALRPIAEGEEICIRYRRPLWFTPAA